NYVNTLGLEIITGRDFSAEFGTDKNEAVLLNETAVRYLGISDNPVARELLLPGGQNGERPVKIIGVIKDFHVQSMQNEIEPLFLYINPDRFYTLAVKFRSGKEQHILNFLEDVWSEVLPERSFNYNFLSNTYDQLYQSEEKIGQMVTIFSVLAILISCLGLFGLASFTVQRKTKEIGVRKVLGATVSGILFSLSRQYAKLVLIASLISFPLSWYLLEKWLQNYAYRIEIGWWNYILAGSIALIVALFAVSFQAIKAAVANPVDSLRYE
ncbi:FtsX-like permease family protein, partial [candidate division KSB1 bacterium]|nr:FtsX-like permease family protein [candidate division KSB1 bacterium]